MPRGKTYLCWTVAGAVFAGYVTASILYWLNVIDSIEPHLGRIAHIVCTSAVILGSAFWLIGRLDQAKARKPATLGPIDEAKYMHDVAEAFRLGQQTRT